MNMTITRAHIRLVYRTLIRQPGYWGPTVILPSLLYAMFGAGLMGSGPMVAYGVASFAVYAVAGVAFFQFGVSLAQEHDFPFEHWRRLLPQARWPGWVAQITCAGLFAFMALALVVFAAVSLGGYAPGALDLFRLGVACLVILVPAAFMGILLGLCVRGQAATAIAMLIFLPLAYLGGLWVPVQLLPDSVQLLSWGTPTRHMVEFLWAVMGLDQRPLLLPAGLLLLDCMILIALCCWRVARRSGK